MADEPGSTAAGAESERRLADLAERKRFCRFSAQDADLLRDLRPVLERHASELVEAFYVHLLAQAPLRPLLADEARVQRLKVSQRDYILSLAAGDYGVEYAAGRLRIGRVHERIGLSPQWYLGTYALLGELIAPLVEERHRDDPPRARRTRIALHKLFILDMQIVLDAYYETRQEHAVERSQQLAAVGELAASIAHEVRNPLAGMKGALEVLRKELSHRPPYQEVADELLAQIDRLEGLVRDLLTFAVPRPLERRALDPRELLDRLMRMHEKQAAAVGIELRQSHGANGSAVLADPQQMEQVFLNLLHNAFQAMDRGGTLTVSTAAGDHRVVVTFQDSGAGIAPDVLPKVFQPFFTTKHRGSGLGLAIVKRIVEAHGGEIEISSATGRGTTARVLLPIARDA